MTLRWLRAFGSICAVFHSLLVHVSSLLSWGETRSHLETQFPRHLELALNAVLLPFNYDGQESLGHKCYGPLREITGFEDRKMCAESPFLSKLDNVSWKYLVKLKPSHSGSKS